MLSEGLVNLSRLQFALTASYHFLFVPLTLGLAILLALMESVYVITKKSIWKDMTKFWGVLFGINVAMGVATGITLEFQFGTNWSYYSQYVGDIFGAPLAIEGLMAFFLEATFIGLFFFGWNKLSKGGHLFATWMVALGSSLSALWILVANGWMSDPVGSRFNFETMRMEVTNFSEVLFNPVAQAKFVHTISAGYITGAIFVMAISAYYLLRKRNLAFAKRSFVIASIFGLASALSVVVLGDESGYLAGLHQKMKLAAIEGMWETETPPASLTLFGIPDTKERVTKYAVKVPYALGLIATRSVTKPVLGIKDIVYMDRLRIRDGIQVYDALTQLQEDPTNEAAKAILEKNWNRLGYALLLKRYVDDPRQATPEDIERAAWDEVPNVPVLFWTFRVMAGLGFFFIAFFIVAVYFTVKKRFERPWFLRLALYSLPLPWIASELGWIVAEYGRQPWVIDGVLPTFLGISSVSKTQVLISLSGFMVFYTALAIVEVFLMVKYIRLGPDGIMKKYAIKES